MAGWIETRLRGSDYFKERREQAFGVLLSALHQRDEGWQPWCGSIGQIQFDFSHATLPISLLIESGAWRSYRERRELAAYMALAGQEGIDARVVLADDVLADVDAVIEGLGIYGYTA